jgi:hypothetical protein
VGRGEGVDEVKVRLSIVLALLTAAGCAEDTGVGAMYGDVLSVTRQGATGFSSATAVRSEAMAEAQAHCISQKRELFLVELQENKPPFMLGNFPRTEVRFMCLEPGDPRLAAQSAG